MFLMYALCSASSILSDLYMYVSFVCKVTIYGFRIGRSVSEEPVRYLRPALHVWNERNRIRL